MCRQTIRRASLGGALVALFALACHSGCSSAAVRSQSPDDKLVAEPAGVELVGDWTSVVGLGYQKVESVALVTNLKGTGSDPPPSTYRTLLLAEMRTHEVKDPNKVLASPDTSLALLVGYLPPGVQKGDRYDISVRVPPQSETTSLRNGWLMASRMKDLAVIDNQLHTGHVLGLAQGPVLVESIIHAGGDEAQLNKHGLVIGGGISQHERSLGLALSQDNKSVRASTALATAVNGRFYMYDRGQKQGVATPKNDRYVELAVVPRYKQNLGRYVRVVRAIPIRENVAERATRIGSLEKQLQQPFTASSAALKLEALGKEGQAALRKGLESPDTEVRFYAAEALAYQDVPEAAEVLKQIARQEPAFRWHALAALGAMDQHTGYDALVDLLQAPSAETRYGAFRALAVRNPKDPQVAGQPLGDQMSLHVVPCNAEPLVHISTNRRPELVIFANELPLTITAPMFAGSEVMLKALPSGRIRLSHFGAGDNDRFHECSPQLREVIPAIVELGGTYGDVIQFCLEANKTGALKAQVLLDALPHPGRNYQREVAQAAQQTAETIPGTPIPDLFAPPRYQTNDPPAPEAESTPENSPPKRSFLGKMTGWMTGD